MRILKSPKMSSNVLGTPSCNCSWWRYWQLLLSMVNWVVRLFSTLLGSHSRFPDNLHIYSVWVTFLNLVATFHNLMLACDLPLANLMKRNSIRHNGMMLAVRNLIRWTGMQTGRSLTLPSQCPWKGKRLGIYRWDPDLPEHRVPAHSIDSW